MIGRAGTGKTTFCFNEIKNYLGDAPQGAPLIWLVPEQSTYICEKMLVQESGLKGSIRAEVLSFERLPYRLLKELGEKPKPVLDKIGQQMALAKMIQKQKNKLSIFSRGANKPGFTTALGDLLKEFGHYQVHPEDLKQILEQKEMKQGQSLGQKLNDIALLYEEWLTFTAEKHYLRPEEGLNSVLTLLQKTSAFQEAELWIDGFADFTPQEVSILAMLLTKAKQINVALCLDVNLYDKKQVAKEQPFYHIWQTKKRLEQIAQEFGIPILPPVLLQQPYRWLQTPSLAHLEAKITSRPHQAWQEQEIAISLKAAANPRTEVFAVAREIQRLCREEGYRYRDIAILARDLGQYQDILQQEFSSLGIPIFLDEAYSLRLHPLVELIRALLTIAAEHFPAEAVWRYLKSGFLLLDKNDIEKLENYCLASGINYGRWQEEKEWNYIPRHWKNKGQEADWQENLVKINSIRKNATALLYETVKQLQKEKPAKELVAILRHHLQSLQVESTLKQWQQEAALSGDHYAASVHAQAYEAVDGLLQQAELLLDDALYQAEDLLLLLDAGFAELEISHIPLEMDMVLAADIEHSRTPEVKASFVLGANDGILPKKMEESGLLSAQERIILEKNGLHLAPNIYRKQIQEEYLLYTILTRSSQKLMVSYALGNQNGQAMFPSTLVGRLKELFPLLQESYLAAEPTGSEDISILLPGSGNISVLAGRLLAKQKGESVPIFWDMVCQYYMQQKESGMSQIIEGLRFRTPVQNISEESVTQIYGKQIKGGISRLEKFRLCPLLHFANYGLRLKKRPQYQPMAPDTGEFYHHALAAISNILQREEIDWARLELEDCQQLAQKITEESLPDFWGDIAKSSSRYRYLSKKLIETLAAVLWAMAYQFQKGEFRPIAWEISFGPQEILPAFCIDLPSGGKLELRGRIDRVDVAAGEHGLWLRVVDYKSSKQNLTLNDAFYGLKMQLLAYLQIVMSNTLALGLKEPTQAAGVYYFTIQNPSVLTDGMIDSQDITKKWRKEFRLNGLAIKDGEAVLKADSSISGYSDIVPVYMRVKKQVDKKTGEVLEEECQFGGNTQGIYMEELQLLQKHLLTILANTAADILSGIAGAKPLEYGNYQACSFCDYQSFCGFDRDLAKKFSPKKLSEEEIWQKLAEEDGQ